MVMVVMATEEGVTVVAGAVGGAVVEHRQARQGEHKVRAEAASEVVMTA